MAQAQYQTGLQLATRILAIGFGAYIATTSLGGIALGVHADDGWLAILYGGLGVSMGGAGIAGVWLKGAARGALLGWFLVGIASRAVVEGDAYLWFISFPIAAALLCSLAFELLYHRSSAKTLAAAAGGSLAILSLVGLAIIAPSLPVICAPKTGTSETLFNYPGDSPPFDVAESAYTLHCLAPAKQ
jgi:hypothetical protein